MRKPLGNYNEVYIKANMTQEATPYPRTPDWGILTFEAIFFPFSRAVMLFFKFFPGCLIEMSSLAVRSNWVADNSLAHEGSPKEGFGVKRCHFCVDASASASHLPAASECKRCTNSPAAGASFNFWNPQSNEIRQAGQVRIWLLGFN